MRILLLTVTLIVISANSYAWCFYDSADLKAKCDCKSSPAKAMREAESYNVPYTVENEVKDENGNAISLVLFKEYPPIKGFLVDSPGGITETHWFKTQKACQDARKEATDERRASEKEESDAKRKKLAPYE